MENPVWLWIAKAFGAFAGSSFSLAFMVPKTHREAGIRLACGVFVGTFFGGLAVDWIEKTLGLDVGSGIERVITGAFIASFVAWYVLGGVVRAIAAIKSPSDLKRE